MAEDEIGQRGALRQGEPADDRPAGAADLDLHRLPGPDVHLDRVRCRPAHVVRIVDVAIDHHPAGRHPLEDEPARSVGGGVVIDPAAEPLVEQPGGRLLPGRRPVPIFMTPSIRPQGASVTSVDAASSSGDRAANPASWAATTQTGFSCGWKRNRPSMSGLRVQRLADDAVGDQPAVLDAGVVVGIAQGHVGAGDRAAVGAADDPRQRRGLAELEVVRDVLDVVEEPEELAGQVAVGLDPDRAVQALVGEQAVGDVVAAVR